MIAFDSFGGNIKIRVEVTIVFEKRFTSVDKDKISFSTVDMVSERSEINKEEDEAEE